MPDASPPLPETLAACHEQLRALHAINAQLQATIDQQQATLRALQRDLALLKRTLFGQRRERYEDPRQGLLFESVEFGETEQPEDDSAPPPDEDKESTPSRRHRRGRVRRVIPESLPRVRRVHELTDADIPEHLQGANVRRFLKKAGEWIEWEPARLKVVEEYVETLAVDQADATETVIVSAWRPPRILNCFAGPSLLAALAVNHFADHLPYYRLEEILGRSQVVIDRSTQCRWMMRLADALAPLIELMRKRALLSQVVQADETPVNMLVPGTGKAKRTYLWAVLGDRRHPYTTFFFTESRARSGPTEFFADFSGTLVCDAYTVYEWLGSASQGAIRPAGCYAHARRKFEELHVLGPTEQTATALGYFQRLFDIEDELRDLSDQQRHEQRQLRSRPLVEEFNRWMDGQLKTLRPKHALRGAINYMTSRWEWFERFLDSGAIPLDNNASEQAVKNPVMGKKAWLFFGSPAGGRTAAIFYTLTATCRRLKIDPYAYLKDVFERLPRCDPMNPKSLTPLLPDQWLAEHPEHRLDQRVAESSTKADRKRAHRKRRRRALARANRKAR